MLSVTCTVTIAIEAGLVQAKTPGVLHLETPGGKVSATYIEENGKVRSVRFTNVPSFLFAQNLAVECPELGTELNIDVAYGGNFYAIIEPQDGYSDLSELPISDVLRISPRLRRRLNAKYSFVHPQEPRISGLSHVLWTGKPMRSGSDPRS